ncbi:MAG: glycosyltransferase family 39 protein [Anaerolineae bacterium]|nr:glycosyltransferase family 39 protein [Anaerolineae bacterium]
MRAYRSIRYQGSALALVLLAFALRLWGLTATSLWYDETFMVYHAQQGVIPGVLGLLREDNALPLHGLLLSLWVQIAGSGEFAVRYLSVLLGVSAVPLVLRLGGDLAGRREGGWGGALVFASLPIHVYYAQEVRMYALAVLLAAAFAWTAWRVGSRARGVILYIILGTLMLLAHLYTGLLWAAFLAWGAMCEIGRVANGEWRITNCESRMANGESRITHRGNHGLLHVSRFTFHPAAWRRANLGLAVSALPIVVWAWWRAGVDATAVSAVPSSVVRWIPVFFGVGQYIPEPWATGFVCIVSLSLVLTGITLLRTRRGAALLWLACTLVLPIALLLATTWVKAKWSERYLLPSFGLALALAVGIGWERIGEWQIANSEWRIANYISRFTSYALILSYLALTLLALGRQAAGTWAVALQDEWHPRPDFRGVADYIEGYDESEDAIVVIGGYAAHTLNYYYNGPARLFGLPTGTRVLDTRQVLDLRALEVLESRLGDKETLWLVLWQDALIDPTGLVQSVLVDACHRLPVSAHFTNVGVLHFDLTSCRPLDKIALPPHPLHESFIEPIQLAGYGVIRQRETWEVDLWWETTGPLTDDYFVFVHLLDAGQGLIAQHDHIAGADAYPTGQWAVGTRMRDRFFLHVPGGDCEACSLHFGLYNETGRLYLQDGRDGINVTGGW